MKFKLNHEELLKHMFKDGEIVHHTGNKIKLFPFPANERALAYKDVLADLQDFRGIAGACFRECLGYSQKNTFNKSDYVSKVCAMANSADNPNLKNIVEKIAFNEKDQLVLFDVLVYPHIHNGNLKENKTLDHIGSFLFTLFFDEPQKLALKQMVNRKPDNLFYKLILSCLPDTRTEEGSKDQYYQASPHIKALFQADLQVLLADQELFIAGFHQLLKFYFFKYITEFAIRLNVFLGKPQEQLFFSVKWEKLQDFRLPLTNGWEMFERNIKPLFSHAVTLELINHIEGFTGPVSYQDIAELIPELNEEDLASLVAAVRDLVQVYKSGFPSVAWEKFEPDFSRQGSSELEKSIIELFQAIEFQFVETKRERAKGAYQAWMKEFTNLNFGRRRGQLGLSLALDHEFLLLVTRLCVGDQDKIRLNNLWDGLVKRGINFDNTSRDHIISYFEKVNLLEKKATVGMHNTSENLIRP